MNRKTETSRVESGEKFKEAVHVLFVHRWVVLIGFMLVMLGTFIYLNRVTPTYKTETVLLREENDGSLYAISSVGTRYFRPPSVESQQRFIKSSLVMGEVAKRMNEMGFPSDPKNLARRIEVTVPSRGDEVLIISATASNGTEAMHLANITADVYIEKTLEMKAKTSEQAERFLKAQMNMVNESLQQAEEALNAFREREGITTSRSDESGRSSGLLDQLGDLYSQLNEAQMNQELTSVQLTTVRELINEKRKEIDPSSANHTTSRIEQLQSMIADWEIQLAVLMQKLKDKSPEVVSLRERIDAAQRTLDQEVQNLIGSRGDSVDPISEWRSLVQQSVQLDIELRRYKQQEALLRKKIEDFKAAHPQLISKQVELTRLERNARIHEQTYMLLMDKYEEVRLQKQMKSAGITVIDKAPKPIKPVSPRKTMTIILGVILGLMLGFGGAIFLEYMDDSLKIEKDVTAALSLPVVGMIPKIDMTKSGGKLNALKRESGAISVPERETGSDARKRRKRKSKRYLQNIRNLKRSIIANFDNRSPVVESYNALNTKIRFAGISSGSPVKTILITSPGPREGKSLTAVNLAIAMARVGTKVLLVDADMRRPLMHAVFSQEKEPGLTELILNGGEEQDGIVRATGIENLSLLPSGSRPPNPVELLSSGKMKSVMQNLRDEFDAIVIDSPPLIPVADPVIIAAEIADTVLFVVRSGQTRRDIALRAKQIMDEMNARVFGVVINEVDYAKRYGSYYYYYYHYYYSEDKE